MTGRRSGRRPARPASLALAGAVLLAGAGCERPGPAPAEAAEATTEAPAARTLLVVFRREAGDRIVVTRADDGAVLRRLESGEGGFLRGALRPLLRERTRYGVEPDRPFALELRTDGALILSDPPTGMTLDVAAFGPTSRQQFLILLDGRPAPVHPTLSTPNGPMEDRP